MLPQLMVDLSKFANSARRLGEDLPHRYIPEYDIPENNLTSLCIYENQPELH